MEPVKEYEVNYKYSVILQKSIFANSDEEAILLAKEMAYEGTVGFTIKSHNSIVIEAELEDDGIYVEELIK